MKNLLIYFALLCSILFSTTTIFAKNINLYEQPKADAKVLGAVDPQVGIIPIFTPKDSTWIKVGDPRNGNVGWVKSSDLSADSNNGFSFRMISTGDGSKGYQVLQIGVPQALSSEQTESMMKQMRERELQFKKDMQQMMQNLINPANTNFPSMMPAVVTPQTPAKAPIVNPNVSNPNQPIKQPQN